MYRSWIKCFLFFLYPLFLLCSSCGFADLRPIEYSTIPGKAYAVLSESYSPVSVRFNTSMHESEIKNIFQILEPSGSVEGEFTYKKNELEFIPAAAWLPGLRYHLKLSGTVRSHDGRELLLARDIPFYALSKSSLPFLESFSPEDGASTGVFNSEDPVLEFVFSESMERRSTEAAFSCEELANKKFLWLDDDKVLKITTDTPLSPWAICRWSISEKAKSKAGAPLAKEFSGCFITDSDYLFPKVVKVVPLLKSDSNGDWGFWSPVAVDLRDGLGPKQALGVEFNKAVNSESVKRSFNFEPSLGGRIEQSGPAKLVFIPERGAEAETLYTMKISKDIRDEAGLKMEDDYVLSFRSDIPFLRIHSVAPDGAETRTNPKTGDIFGPLLNEEDNGTLRFTIRFSLSLTTEAQKDAAFKISLKPFFPETLKTPVLKFARWINSDSIRMEWECVEPGKPEAPHFYKLTLPGGANGIVNGDASILKEDVYFFIEAKQ